MLAEELPNAGYNLRQVVETGIFGLATWPEGVKKGIESYNSKEDFSFFHFALWLKRGVGGGGGRGG